MSKTKVKSGGGYPRQSSIDSCKAIAAFSVVLIHFGFPGIVGSSLQAICRWAVPYFFMVSGYFAYSDSWDSKRIAMKSLRISKMALVAVVIYLIYYAAINGVSSIISELSLANVVKFVLFNAPQVSSAHLWFLFALIYCYLLMIATHKLLGSRFLKLYIVVALTLHALIAEVLPSVGILTFAHPIVRNAYLFGYPFFLIGYYIRKDEAQIDRVKKYAIVVAAIFGAVLVIFEHAYLVSSDLLELYVGSIIMSVSVFVLSIKFKSAKPTALSYIGKDYSMIVYIVHPMVGRMITIAIGQVPNQLKKWLLPVIVLMTSLILAILIENICDKLRNCNRKRRDFI